MKHDEKIAQLHRHMASVGVSPFTTAPPAWRLLWWLGAEVPPPMFLSFPVLAASAGVVFAVLFGLAHWLLPFLPGLGSPIEVMVVAGVAGLVFGLAMAAIYRGIARRHGLASWSDYRGHP